ncbi:MAG: amino acid permease, partial [Myxococcales bacterium]|nr:amino acid permease [Myxococcales bacterium]
LFGYASDDKEALRIAGSISLLAVTAITLISTTLAIRIQYLIMGAIVLSLLGIFLGPRPYATGEIVTGMAPVGAHSIAWIFAIFFPAVTGFTAGVNMSGDLKDPKRAIPLGTLAAIGVGLLIYVGLAVFIAASVSRDQLQNNPNVLLEVAVEDWMVYAGIWGATLSSAIGSIMGAPRILQAKSQDRLTPAVFAVGRGPSNEPRNALFLTFVIAEAGILIGELDVIASIISMFFIMMYGFLNLSCAIENLVSPDFRPSFRIPVAVSVIGAIACVVVMIQIDMLAMLAATAMFIGIFLYYSSRQLTLDTGDTWSGVWTTVARSALRRLQKGETHHRNWRPNVVLFSERGAASREPLLAFTESLMSGRGIVTDVELVEGDKDALPAEAAAETRDTPARPGVFHRPTPTDDVYATMEAIVRFYGFSGVEPNTVMLDWSQRRHGAPGFLHFLDTVRQKDLNLVVLAHDPKRAFGERRRIDVWCGPNGENMALALALLRFVTTSNAWRSGELRFVVSGADANQIERMRRVTQRVLEDNRLQASVISTSALRASDALESQMGEISEGADLVIASLPDDIAVDADEWARRTDDLLLATRGSLMLVRASEQFEERFRQHAGLDDARPRRAHATLIDDELGDDELRPLMTPDVPELRAEAMRFGDAVDMLAETLHQRHLTSLVGFHRELVTSLAELFRRQLGQLKRTLAAEGPAARQRKAIARAQSSIVFQTLRTFEAFERQELPVQRDLLADAVRTFKNAVEGLGGETPAFVTVERPSVDFDDDADDPPHLRRLKRRLRVGAWFARRSPIYRVAPARLHAHYLEHQLQEEVAGTLRGFAIDSYHLLSELGRLALSTASLLDELDRDLATLDDPAALVASEEARILVALETQAAELDAGLHAERKILLKAARRIAQAFSDDLDRLDFARAARRERKVPRSAAETASQLDDAPDRWLKAQAMIVHRTSVGARVAAYQRRLKAVVERARHALTQHFHNAVLGPTEALHQSLVDFRARLAAGDETPLRVSDDLTPRFAPEPMVEALVRDTQAATLELPESIVTTSDAELAELSQRPFEPPTGVALPLRRAVGHLVEAQLIGDLQEQLARIPEAERHALRVGLDVLRLLSFTASEFGVTEDGEPLDEAVRTQLAQAAENGVARVAAEVEALRALEPQLERRLAERLVRIREQTDPEGLMATPERAKDFAKSSAEPGFVRAVRSAVASVGRGVRRATVAVIYRRTRGALLQRRLRPAVRPADALVERSLKFVRTVSPKAEVVEALPFFYRQLFLGRSANDSSFWVGRERALLLAEEAIANHRRGVGGALLAVGAVGSGKSALIQRVLRKHVAPERTYRIRTRPGGAIDPDVFREQAGEAIGVRGSWADILRAVPADSAIVVENLALWWERSEGGLALVDQLLELIDQHGARCLFVIEVATPTFRAINRFRGLAARALAVVECEPVDSEVLRDVVELRHRSAGLTYELDGKAEGQLSDLRRARLFSGLFDQSHGLLGPALQSWIATIERVRGTTIELRAPERKDTSFLEDLPLSRVAVLVQLVLHRQVTDERLARITGLDRAEVARELAMLVRMGLVVRIAERVYGLDRFVRHHVVEHLEARELLP